MPPQHRCACYKSLEPTPRDLLSQAAGFPDILPLGAVALGEQDGMHGVFEVSPPSWDLRMAQLDAQGPGPAFLQVTPCVRRACGNPAPRPHL